MNTPPEYHRISVDDIKTRIAYADREGLVPGELDLLAADAANNIKNELVAEADAFREGATRGFNSGNVIRDIIVLLSKPGNDLWRCDPASILGAAMNANQLGLRVDVGGQSFLIPYWSAEDGMMKAQFMIGYQGWVSLCYRSGMVVDIASEIVYEKEFHGGRFKFWHTEDKPHLHHEPDLTIASVDAPMFAFYAKARTKGKGYFITRPWSLGMMLEHRDRYAMTGRDGEHTWFWRDHLPAAARKTMVRHLTQLMPKSLDLETAFSVDGGVRTDYTPGVQPGEATLHETPFRPVTTEQAELTNVHPADR